MRKWCRSHKKTSKFHYHSRISRIRQRSSSIRIQYICRSIFAITTETIFFDRTMLEAISRSFEIVYIHSTCDNVFFHHWKYLKTHLQRLIIWFWDKNQQRMSSSYEIFLMRRLQHRHFEHYLFSANRHESQCELYTSRENRLSWLISEYSFQRYQLIIVSFVDNFSNSFRLNNVVFHLRSFQEFFNMRMSQHNSSVQRGFRQIVDVKFKRRCRFYYEFWRFRIENDHHYCVKYENSRYILACLSRVRKIFRKS
jgi:hypothetical protein